MKTRRAPAQRPHGLFFETLEDRTLFAFGVTTTTTSFVVDTGANVVFTVLRSSATATSTVHVGDLTSVTYKGTETLAPYSLTSRYSHYEQGLSSTTAVTATVDPNGQWILIACDDSASGDGSAIQYYAARKGEDNIYMASLPTNVFGTTAPGEGRFIAYMNKSVFTNIEASSDISTTDTAVEGSDVFVNSTTGITKSKFYNTREMINNQVHGITGTGIGAFMNMGNREHSAGGPFFKDIDFQTTSAATEMYNVLFSGHTQTETYRQGLQGPYAMQYTDGSAPAALDFSWMSALNLQGWIPAASRGAISGTASGVTAHTATVTLSNANAQYWATPNAATGAYSITGVQAGTYTETLYDNELAVGTRTVTISAGVTTRANIADTYYIPPAVWRIGSWDGTPEGFLNSDKINTMHPSDVRMSNWVLGTYTVGTTADSAWPLAQFKDVNNNPQIVFNLTAAQAATAMTMRIGISLAFAGGRPFITVNTGQTYAWTSAIPASSTQPNSRGITRGTWRGNNTVFTYAIPTSALKAGTNTINIVVASGDTTTGFLSPSITYDAIDLVSTASLTNAPVVTTMTITPPNPTEPIGSSQTFVANAFDQFGNATTANVVWTASRGTIDGTGLYVTPTTAGSDTVTATYNGVSASTTVNVVADVPPTIATAASATPNPTTATTTVLSVLGADNNGEANLTYTWATTGTPPAAVIFSANGTNAAKSTTATFTQAGTYTFQVTATDASNLTATSTVSVNVSFGAFTGSLDVGSPALAGSLSYDTTAGAYTIKGEGTDIWSTADQFRYSYGALSGDGSILARVKSVTNTATSAKSGVMFRDSTASNAAYAFVWISPSGTVKFETRASNGVSSVYSASVASASPIYVRILRSANTFAAYYSADAVTWKQVGVTQTVTMATAALAGLAVTSHNAASLNTAVFDNVSMGSAPSLVSAVSRKQQGTGTYDTSLSLNSASPTIEGRTGGANTIVFNFSESIFAADGAISANEFTLTNAAFSAATISGATLTLTLSSVANAARLTVGLTGLVDSAGNALTGTKSVIVRDLLGDVDQSGTVDSADSNLIKKASGQKTTALNYLLDINASGSIDAVDIAIDKNLAGTTAP